MASFLGQVVGALLCGFGPGETNDLVGEAVPSSRKISLLDHVIDRIFLHARNEENPVLRPAGEKAVVIVGTVHGNDGTRSQVQQSGRLHVVALRLSYYVQQTPNNRK